MKKTEADIINETLDRIKEKGRALDRYGKCLYYSPEDGNMCAIGAVLLDAKYAEERYGGEGVSEMANSELVIDHLIEQEYRGHDFSFWELLQLFHDTDENWNGLREINEEGIRILKEDLNFDYHTRKSIGA